MGHNQNICIKLVREHLWGLLLLVALLLGSSFAVKTWKAKHPGSMTVIESQAMDMTVMKTPVGAVPVATEVVHLGKFTAKVRYTGSVVPLEEQIIYPRVEGWLKNLEVYNGDAIPKGRLIAVVDSPDLQTKLAEASAGHAAAASEIPKARFDAARMASERAAAQGEIDAAKGEVARAKATVSAAEKAVVQKQKEVKGSEANLEYWKAEIVRQEKLLKAGAVSLQEYQSEKAEATAAEAELENKQAMLDEAKADVEAAKAEVVSKQSMVSVAALRAAAAESAVAAAGQEIRQKSAMARQAGAMLNTAATVDSYRYIRAPFAGTLTKRYTSPGQFVTPSTAIASIVQIDKVRLQANVSDKDLAGIRVGAPITAHFAKDSNLAIDATVTSVSPLADQSSRTAVVEATVDNPGHKLVPGDSVTLDIAVSGVCDAITVPISAIVQKDGHDAVWIVKAEAAKGKKLYTCTMHPEVSSDKPGPCPKCNMQLVPKVGDGNKKAHLVMVNTGATSGDRVEIVTGLSDGDEVINQGNTYLKEGDTVFPTEWTVDGPKELPKAPGMDSTQSMPGMAHKPDSAVSVPQVKHESSETDSMPGMNRSPSPQPSPTRGEGVNRKWYVCPMHPHEMTHNPKDRCKICGMNLVEKK